MQIIRTVVVLRRHIGAWRQAEESVALVPTMGALHSGHMELVHASRKRAGRSLVSIFVNPAQFAPEEDFGSYPRTFESDYAKLEKAGVDAVFAPEPVEMYPTNFATTVVVAGPAAVGLEDAFRPHFFKGVATIVAKLLLQTLPDFALFGEKDYQQLLVVRQMARDLDIPVEIVGIPTVRESDGLALSSRNSYLNASERLAAATLARVLAASATAIRKGEPMERVLSEGRTEIEAAGFRLEYLEARDGETLAPVGSATDGSLRLLVAARIGGTRLIDNVGV